MPQMRPYCSENNDSVRMQNKLLDSIDTDLLSLSELWGEKAEQERAERVDSLKLEEERLKREVSSHPTTYSSQTSCFLYFSCSTTILKPYTYDESFS